MDGVTTVKKPPPIPREKLEEALRLTSYIARRIYRTSSGVIPLEDLEGEGTIAIVDAWNRYESDRGASWATFVAHYIRGYLFRWVVQNPPSGMRLGSSETFYVLMKRFRLGLSNEAIAEEMGQTPEWVGNYRARYMASLYPTMPSVGGESPEEGMHLLSAPSGVEEEEHQEECSYRVGVILSRASLNTRELQVVTDRVMAEEPKTLEELGEEWGVSRERVRQVETKALGKLRRVAAESFGEEGL